MRGKGKLVELEAVRGIAACVVFLHHFLLQFLPHLHGRQFPDDSIALVRTPAFAFVNGTAAVAVFFVLSGFVLTVRTFQRGDRTGLLLSAAKRWPRLAVAATASNLFAGLFLAAGLFLHEDRTWLDPLSYGGFWGVMHAALKEGCCSTFFYGNANFNAALWTMHYELFGSIFVYATAAIMLFARDLKTSLAACTACFLSVAIFTGEGGELFATLIVGTLIARIYQERPAPIVLGWPAILLIWCVALVLCGYDGFSTPAGFYAFMASIASPRTEHIVHAAGATIIIAFVLYHLPTRRALSGGAGSWLGRLSFPIYLVHLPILHGIGHPLHLWLSGYFADTTSIALTFVATAALTLLAALPLMWLDEWWVAKLREWPRKKTLALSPAVEVHGPSLLPKAPPSNH